MRCFGLLSSCKIQSAVSAPNIFAADLRRPRSYIWSIFWAFKFSVKSSKQPKPRREKHPQTFASFRQIVDCFIGFITLNPLLHERFWLFDVFLSGRIGHKWSLWMDTQEDRFKTFRVHRTHYDSRQLSRTIRALLNRLGNCAVVLSMYFHQQKKSSKISNIFRKSRTRSCWTDCKWVERLNRLKIIKDVEQQNLEVANERQAKYYNLRRRPISYEIGEQILRGEKTLSNEADNMAKKLNKNFEGPFFIKTKITWGE